MITQNYKEIALNIKNLGISKQEDKYLSTFSADKTESLLFQESVLGWY